MERMPKILPNQREVFLNNAKKILKKEGCGALSIRRLANDSGVATGTLYNYFRSKEDLIAAVMLDDWKKTLKAMQIRSAEAPGFAEGLTGIRQCIAEFVKKYRPLWMQYIRGGGSGKVIGDHHEQLIAQIAGTISALISRTGDEGLSDLSLILAETVLTAAQRPEITDSTLHLLAERLNGKEKRT